MNKHRWLANSQEYRCTYCDIRWHPSRQDQECQAQFPIDDHSIFRFKDTSNKRKD